MTKHRLLVVYATKHGSTQEVASELAATLHEHGFEVSLYEADEIDSVEGFDAVVVGGSLYMGRWHPHARTFLKRHHTTLRELPVAVFALGPQDLEPEHVAQSRHQLERALEHTPDVEPIAVAIFGGVVDPSKLQFPFSRMKPLDMRDWDAVHGWGDEVARAVEGRVEAHA